MNNVHIENILPNERLKSRLTWISGFLCASLIIIQPFLKDSKPQKQMNMTMPMIVGKDVSLLTAPANLPEQIVTPRFSPFSKTTSPLEAKLTLRPQQNFRTMFKAYGIAPQEINLLEKKLTNYANLDRLKVGTHFQIKLTSDKHINFDDKNAFAHSLNMVTFRASPGLTLEAKRTHDDYRVKEIYSPITSKGILKTGNITSSLYKDAQNAGIPAKMTAQFIKRLSYNVDFRDLKHGDNFEFGFNEYYDDNGLLVGTSPLRYASVTIAGKKHEIFYLIGSDGKGEWFDNKGQQNKSLLMKTPIDGARLSSGFGYRQHPILGYNKMHRGIDFAAPTGTPIYASGDGVVIKQYRSPSYGNYVEIKHTGVYSTAYAHMSRFRKGLFQGSSVKQGQVIGYVGTTGRSTGPHLHYEVLRNGVQINPLSKDIPTVSPVNNETKRLFTELKQEMEQRRKGKITTQNYKSIKDVENQLM